MIRFRFCISGVNIAKATLYSRICLLGEWFLLFNLLIKVASARLSTPRMFLCHLHVFYGNTFWHDLNMSLSSNLGVIPISGDFLFYSVSHNRFPTSWFIWIIPHHVPNFASGVLFGLVPFNLECVSYCLSLPQTVLGAHFTFSLPPKQWFLKDLWLLLV